MDNEALDRYIEAIRSQQRQSRAFTASVLRIAHDLERQFASVGLPFVFDFAQEAR